MQAVSEWNPFLGAETAENYARARPDYHPAAIAAATRCLDLQLPLARAVDVGCGTGMSSRALVAIADQVVGLDVSRPMLRAAAPSAGVHYVQAAAERLPLATASAELVVTAAAFHWFDQQAMLAEAARVLVPGGALAVYTDYFAGRLVGADDCAAWLVDTYRTRLPAPARRSQFDADAAAAAGFRYVGEQHLDHEVSMNAATLTDYLLSQSNATSAVDSGRWTLAELRCWLRAELERRLPAGGAAAVFTGIVRCCRKAP